MDIQSSHRVKLVFLNQDDSENLLQTIHILHVHEIRLCAKYHKQSLLQVYSDQVLFSQQYYAGASLKSGDTP